MARNAEANLLLRIKEQGKEALTKIGENLESIRNKAALASAALTGFMGLSVKKYAEQEEAGKALNRVLENQGSNVDELSKKYTALAQAIQDKTTQDDGAIVKGIALARAFTGQLELTEDLIKATVDFAAFTGQDLEQAFTMVGKSIGTTTNALARSGVELDSNATKAEKMEVITRKLSTAYGGFAEAQREGSGELKAFTNTLDDLLAELGKEYMPTLIKATKETAAFIKVVTNNKELVEWTAKLVAAGAAFTALVAAMATFGLAWPGIVTAFTLMSGAAGTVLAVLSGPVGIAAALVAMAGGAAYASGALDGVISKAKELAGIDTGPAFDPDKNEGDQKYVMMTRAKERAKQIADAEIQEAKRSKAEQLELAEQAAKEREKVDRESLKARLEDQEDHWKELKRLKKDAEDEHREHLQEIANNPVKVLFEKEISKEELANAGIGLATGFLAGLQNGAEGARQMGATVAEGMGNVLQDKLNNAIGDDALFGLGGMFKELFAFSSQSEEQIKAQTKAFVEAIPGLIEATVKFAPAFVEALLDAVGDPAFWDGFIKAMGRATAANGDALARQWGIKSGEEFFATMKDKVGGFFETIWDGFESLFGNFFSNIGNFLSGIWSAIGQMFSGVGDLFGKIGESVKNAVSSVFGNIGDILSDKLGGFLGKFNEVLQQPKEMLSNFVNGFRGVFDNLKDSVTGIFDKIKSALTDPLEGLKKIFEGFTNAVKGITGGGGGGVTGAAKSAIGKIGSALGFQSGGQVPGYANGGYIMPSIQKFAAGGTTDTVPAMLTPGEFVINREATKNNLGLLQSINAGAGGGGGAGTTVNITVNGGFLGDEASARQLARAIDQQLLKLRQGNQSVAFDAGVS